MMWLYVRTKNVTTKTCSLLNYAIQYFCLLENIYKTAFKVIP